MKSPHTIKWNYKSVAYLFCVLVFVSVLFYEAMQSPTINNETIPHLDKIAHFFAFSLLTLLVVNIFEELGSEVNLLQACTIILIVSVIGGVDEGIQSITSTRKSSIMDLLADVGGCISILTWKVYIQLK